MKSVILDSDTISYYLRGDEKLIRNFEFFLSTNKATFFISIITHYEILSGLIYRDAKKRLEKYLLLKKESEVLDLTESIIAVAARNYAALRKKGKTIGDMDLLIAATAIENNMVLITNNEKHFKQIPKLKLANWMK